jgi:hypothetical protein
MLTFMILAVLAAPPEFEAPLASGEKVVGQLIELSANRTVLEASSGPRDVHGQATELRRRGAAAPERAPLWVVLEDNSSLPAKDYRSSAGKAEITLTDGRLLKLDERLVKSVYFRQQAPAGASWAVPDNLRTAGDVLEVRKQAGSERLTGVLGDITDETIKFQLDGEWLSVKRGKVLGIAYAAAAKAPPLPPAFCTLTDASGARLAAEHVTIEKGHAQIRTPTGLTFSIPLERLDSIRFKVQFLSDLEPQRSVYTPLVGGPASTKAESLFFQPRLNRSLEPGGLRLGDRVYAKGLAMHSRSELVFRLPGDFRRLQALAGIDDAVRPGGNVRLSIYGDDRLLLEEVITGRDKPRRLDLDIRGVARLKIVADFNGDEVSDHLDLCEARILE